LALVARARLDAHHQNRYIANYEKARRGEAPGKKRVQRKCNGVGAPLTMLNVENSHANVKRPARNADGIEVSRIHAISYCDTVEIFFLSRHVGWLGFGKGVRVYRGPEAASRYSPAR
jgi:hypothetical protein